MITSDNRFRLIGYAALIVALSAWPIVTSNPFYLRLATEILIYGLLAMSLDVLLGYTGLLSFMHVGYMGIAAYSVGLFLVFVDPSASLWFLLLIGTGAAALVAFPVGWLQVRTGGFAFALLTIAFGMMFYTIVWKARDITGGDDGLIGIPSPSIGIDGWSLGTTKDPGLVYYLTVMIVGACYLITRRIVQSPFGAVLASIRENEERASFIGFNVRRYKLGGWMLACSLAGIAGCLSAFQNGFVTPTIMDATAGGSVLMMTLLGGLGTLWGPYVGAGIYIALHDYTTGLSEHWMIFLGLAVILLVLFLPEGIAGLIRRVLRNR